MASLLTPTDLEWVEKEVSKIEEAKRIWNALTYHVNLPNEYNKPNVVEELTKKLHGVLPDYETTHYPYGDYTTPKPFLECNHPSQPRYIQVDEIRAKYAAAFAPAAAAEYEIFIEEVD